MLVINAGVLGQINNRQWMFTMLVRPVQQRRKARIVVGKRGAVTKQELKGAALDKFFLQKRGKRRDGIPVPKVFVMI